MKVNVWNCDIDEKDEYYAILRALGFLERSYFHKQLDIKLCCNTDCGVEYLFNSFDSYFGNLDEDDNLMCDIEEDSVLLILQAINYQIKNDGRLQSFEMAELEKIKNEILRVVELNEEEESAIHA